MDPLITQGQTATAADGTVFAHRTTTTARVEWAEAMAGAAAVSAGRSAATTRATAPNPQEEDNIHSAASAADIDTNVGAELADVNPTGSAGSEDADGTVAMAEPDAAITVTVPSRQQTLSGIARNTGSSSSLSVEASVTAVPSVPSAPVPVKGATDDAAAPIVLNAPVPPTTAADDAAAPTVPSAPKPLKAAPDPVPRSGLSQQARTQAKPEMGQGLQTVKNDNEGKWRGSDKTAASSISNAPLARRTATATMPQPVAAVVSLSSAAGVAIPSLIVSGAVVTPAPQPPHTSLTVPVGSPSIIDTSVISAPELLTSASPTAPSGPALSAKASSDKVSVTAVDAYVPEVAVSPGGPSTPGDDVGIAEPALPHVRTGGGVTAASSSVPQSRTSQPMADANSLANKKPAVRVHRGNLAVDTTASSSAQTRITQPTAVAMPSPGAPVVRAPNKPQFAARETAPLAPIAATTSGIKPNDAITLPASAPITSVGPFPSLSGGPAPMQPAPAKAAEQAEIPSAATPSALPAPLIVSGPGTELNPRSAAELSRADTATTDSAHVAPLATAPNTTSTAAPQMPTSAVVAVTSAPVSLTATAVGATHDPATPTGLQVGRDTTPTSEATSLALVAPHATASPSIAVSRHNTATTDPASPQASQDVLATAQTPNTGLAPVRSLGALTQQPNVEPQDVDGAGEPATLVAASATGKASTTTGSSTLLPTAGVASATSVPLLTAAASAVPPAAIPPLQGPAAKAATTNRATDAAPSRGGPTRSAPSGTVAIAQSQGSQTAPVTNIPVTNIPVSTNLLMTAAITTAAVTPARWTSTDTSTSTSGPTLAGLSPLTGFAAGALSSATTGAPVTGSTATATAPGYVPATPDAMAASIVAMYRSGQSSLVLRLDPPGLGPVSVHVALGTNSDVNVLFVPAVAQTAHLLQAGLVDLRHAMAASGLTLGQAQIGGGAGGGAGGRTSDSNSQTPSKTASRLAATAAIPSQASLPETATRGVRAIA
jgi:flagellar hook-length control protein FliK